VYPKYKELAKSYAGRALFLKVDIAAHTATAEKAGIEEGATPVFQFYVGGSKKDETSKPSEDELKDMAKEYIKASKGDDDDGGGSAGSGSCEPEKYARRTWTSLKKRTAKRIKRAAEDDNAEKVIIIGSGPAGLSAATYAARAGLKPVLIAPPFGGQLMGTSDVENYPGLHGDTLLNKKIEGPDIVSLFQQQAEKYGTTFENKMVMRVDFSKRPFTVWAATKEKPDELTVIKSESIIITTGADAMWLNVKGEDTYKTKGLSSCATCDGFLYKNKNVLVVGGGDTAMEDALVLARTSKSVTLVHRRDTFRASHVLQKRLLSHKKVTVMWNTTVEEFVGDKGGLTKAVLKTVGKEEPTTMEVPGAFIAIGHSPNTKIFKEQLEMNAQGYLFTKPGSTYTSVEGVFAAGDVADQVYRQAVTSAGTGAMAALDAERWLSENGIGVDDEEEIEYKYECDGETNLKKWRVKQLRLAIRERKLVDKGCIEKKDYVEVLQKWIKAEEAKSSKKK
jgi:thioredoxin reductase (NADPH)